MGKLARAAGVHGRSVPGDIASALVDTPASLTDLECDVARVSGRIVGELFEPPLVLPRTFWDAHPVR